MPTTNVAVEVCVKYDELVDELVRLGLRSKESGAEMKEAFHMGMSHLVEEIQTNPPKKEEEDGNESKRGTGHKGRN